VLSRAFACARLQSTFSSSFVKVTPQFLATSQSWTRHALAGNLVGGHVSTLQRVGGVGGAEGVVVDNIQACGVLSHGEREPNTLASWDWRQHPARRQSGCLVGNSSSGGEEHRQSDQTKHLCGESGRLGIFALLYH
jgi:hypothetical protein